MDDRFIERFLKSIRAETPESAAYTRCDRQHKSMKRRASSDAEREYVSKTFKVLRKELKALFQHRKLLSTAGFSAGRDSVKKPPAHRHCFASAETQAAFFRKIQATYGLTKVAYLRMLTEQESRCLCCQKQLTLFASERAVVPVVDHCHKTGKVRGLLCTGCNTVVGRVESNSEIVLKARQYLELTTGKTPVSLD